MKLEVGKYYETGNRSVIQVVGKVDEDFVVAIGIGFQLQRIFYNVSGEQMTWDSLPTSFPYADHGIWPIGPWTAFMEVPPPLKEIHEDRLCNSSVWDVI